MASTKNTGKGVAFSEKEEKPKIDPEKRRQTVQHVAKDIRHYAEEIEKQLNDPDSELSQHLYAIDTHYARKLVKNLKKSAHSMLRRSMPIERLTLIDRLLNAVERFFHALWNAIKTTVDFVLTVTGVKWLWNEAKRVTCRFRAWVAQKVFPEGELILEYLQHQATPVGTA